MDKKEPLKGKMIDDNCRAIGEENFCYVENYFLKKDIRSAVEWLKQELGKDAKKAYDKDCEGGAWEQDGILWAIDKAIEKIDKAFPDIVKKVKGKK